jgi:membrane protein implicated in regulation of membrane protease activity
VFLILAIVLLIFLPSPWGLVGFTICLVLFFGELLFWNRTMRGRRKVVGAQTLVGQEAEVIAPASSGRPAAPTARMPAKLSASSG